MTWSFIVGTVDHKCEWYNDTIIRIRTTHASSWSLWRYFKNAIIRIIRLIRVHELYDVSLMSQSKQSNDAWLRVHQLNDVILKMQSYTIIRLIRVYNFIMSYQWHNHNYAVHSPEDYEWLAKHTPTQRVTYPPGFKFMYVAQSGQIVENNRPSSGSYIEIVGSPQTAHSALYTVSVISLACLYWLTRLDIGLSVSWSVGGLANWSVD